MARDESMIEQPEPRQGYAWTKNRQGAAAFAIRNAITLPDIVRLTALGYSPRAIAEITKRDIHTIYQLMREPAFVESMERLREHADRRAGEFRERLAVASEAALDRIIALSEGAGTEHVKLSANKSIIEFAGIVGPARQSPQGVRGDVNVFNFDPASFERIVDALREVAGKSIGSPRSPSREETA